MKYILLTNENIAQSVSDADAALAGINVEKKERLRLTLMLENVFLDYQAQFGSETKYCLEIDRKFKHIRFTVHVDSPKLNPLLSDEESGITGNLLSMQGAAPFWSYTGSENVIVFRVRKPKKMPMLATLAIAIVLAVAAGLLCSLLPEGVRTTLSEKVVSPLFDTLMRAISCIAGPLIFLSVAWGIYSIGDVASLKNIGKRMCKNFFLYGFLLFAIGVLVILPFFQIETGSNGSISLSYFYELILGIVPGDIVSPFGTGQTLQIIFLAVCFGLAALILGKKTTVVSQFVEQINFIVQLIMDAISGMIALFVFLSVFTNLISGTFGDLAKAYYFFPTMILSCLVTMGVSLVVVGIRFRVSPKTLLKKMVSTYVIALTTASSAAAFSANVSACIDRLGIDRKLAIFGIPLGQVVYCTGSCLSFAVIGLCVASISGVAITSNWLISLVVMSFILGIATPPIPGGSLASFTIFAAQLGIPAQSVSICLALSIIADFFATSTNLFNLQLNLIWTSHGLSMLDTEELRSKTN